MTVAAAPKLNIPVLNKRQRELFESYECEYNDYIDAVFDSANYSLRDHLVIRDVPEELIKELIELDSFLLKENIWISLERKFVCAPNGDYKNVVPFSI